MCVCGSMNIVPAGKSNVDASAASGASAARNAADCAAVKTPPQQGQLTPARDVVWSAETQAKSPFLPPCPTSSMFASWTEFLVLSNSLTCHATAVSGMRAAQLTRPAPTSVARSGGLVTFRQGQRRRGLLDGGARLQHARQIGDSRVIGKAANPAP